MGKSAWPLTKSIVACSIGTVIATGTMFASVYLRKSYMAGLFIAPEPFIASSLSFAIAIALAVLLSLLLIGLPVQSVMQAERITGYAWHVLPALVFGAALYSGLMSALNPIKPAIEINDIVRGGGLGFIAASIAWLIRRPDLDGGARRIVFMTQPHANMRKRPMGGSVAHRALKSTR
jgi:hypothetical protein